MDAVNKFLADNYNAIIRPRIVCKDGYSFSYQASAYHYCTPRSTFKPNEKEKYTQVELGYPSEDDELIHDYCEDPDHATYDIYPYVPVRIVNQLIEKHGGIVEVK